MSNHKNFIQTLQAPTWMRVRKSYETGTTNLTGIWYQCQINPRFRDQNPRSHQNQSAISSQSDRANATRFVPSEFNSVKAPSQIHHEFTASKTNRAHTTPPPQPPTSRRAAPHEPPPGGGGGITNLASSTRPRPHPDSPKSAPPPRARTRFTARDYKGRDERWGRRGGGACGMYAPRACGRRGPRRRRWCWRRCRSPPAAASPWLVGLWRRREEKGERG